jgi:hypothetical protein
VVGLGERSAAARRTDVSGGSFEPPRESPFATY